MQNTHQFMADRFFVCFDILLSRADSALPSSLNDFVIGRTNEGVGSRDMGTMTIDDFQFWSRQMSENEIRESGTLLTLCILMDYSFWFDTINLELSIVCIWGVRLCFYKCIFGLKFLLTLTTSVDPDEMPHYAAFHLGLHCLSKCLFINFPYTCTQGLASMLLYPRKLCLWWVYCFHVVVRPSVRPSVRACFRQ